MSCGGNNYVSFKSGPRKCNTPRCPCNSQYTFSQGSPICCTVENIWQDYTPIIEGVTLSNNSSFAGRFQKVDNTVFFTVSLVQSGNATSSLTNFFISLPIQAKSTTFSHIGTGLAIVESGSVTSLFQISCELDSVNTFQLFILSNTTGPVAMPVTFLTATDSIQFKISGFYECI